MFGREWKFSQPAYNYRYNHLICEIQFELTYGLKEESSRKWPILR